MPPDPVSEIAKEVAAVSATAGREAALRCAMSVVEPLLNDPSDSLRIQLHRKVFTKSHFRGAGYQVNDFESVDYGQYELTADLPMFRGPRVRREALERGDYFCVLGAAQTFGRLVRRSWPQLLSEALDLPVLNLSRGGVGPELFLDQKLIQLACSARFVIVQVMSGRSVGCEEYPGGRRISQGSRLTKLKRLDLLESMWRDDPGTAVKYVDRWNATYLQLYRQLRSFIDRPTLLLWISDRRPDAWEPEHLLTNLDWGSFPQLIGGRVFYSVAAMFSEHLMHVFVPSDEQPLSRVTGKPCPFFWSDKKLHSKFGYYPSSMSNTILAESLLPWARTVSARQ